MPQPPKPGLNKHKTATVTRPGSLNKSVQFTPSSKRVSNVHLPHKTGKAAHTPITKVNGIIVYGKQVGTNLNAVLLIVKTNLYSKTVYTNLPCPSLDVITHKPIKPTSIDLTPYDAVVRDPAFAYDALILNIGGDFAFGGGVGVGWQIVVITKGDGTGMYLYKPATANLNFGLSLGAGISAGVVVFNPKNFDKQKKKSAKLDAGLFEGASQGLSIGGGPVNVSVITSYIGDTWHLTDLWSMGDQDVLYRAYMSGNFLPSIPFEIDYGVHYSFSRSKLWLSFPFKL